MIYLTDNKCSTFNEPILFEELIESFSIFQFHSLRNKELLFELKIIKLVEFSIKSFQSFKMSLLYSNFYRKCYIMKNCFWKLCNFFNSLRLVQWFSNCVPRHLGVPSEIQRVPQFFFDKTKYMYLSFSIEIWLIFQLKTAQCYP